MTMNRRQLGAGAVALIAMPFVGGAARAQAATTLRLHHFLPPVSNAHAKLLAPWARKVEAESQGKIKIDIFPATEVFELPFIASKRGIVNARAAQEFADMHLKDEVKDVKMLAYWAHDAGVIHANRAVRTMDDLKGLKLRNPTRLAGEALKALGATSVGMPIPQVPESLAQRVIDGAVIPWEVVPAVRVQELVRFHTEIPGSPTLYTASFFLAMNKAKYDGLPADARAVIDANSGQAFAAMAGPMWDNEATAVSAMVRARSGNTISAITEEEKQRWIKATEPVHAAWIEQVKARGLDGAKMIADARRLVAKYEAASG